MYTCSRSLQTCFVNSLLESVKYAIGRIDQFNKHNNYID